MTPTATKSYVRLDEGGTLRVGDSRVSLDSVVIEFLKGESAESIRRNFPVLSLEEVYGTIAYYLGHRGQVDAYLRSRRRSWDEFRGRCESDPSPAAARLRAMKRADAGTGP